MFCVGRGENEDQRSKRTTTGQAMIGRVSHYLPTLSQLAAGKDDISEWLPRTDLHFGGGRRRAAPCNRVRGCCYAGVCARKALIIGRVYSQSYM